MTISDANAIAECVTHGIAVDTADAAKQALEAGLDMDMTSNAYSETLAELITWKSKCWIELWLISCGLSLNWDYLNDRTVLRKNARRLLY